MILRFIETLCTIMRTLREKFIELRQTRAKDARLAETEDNYVSFDDEIQKEEDIPRKSKKLPFVLLGIILILACLSSATYSLDESHYAYVTRMSKLVTIHDEPGLKLKIPLIDKATGIPSYKMLYDVPPSEVITADKKTLVVDNFVVWRINDPKTFVQTLRGSISEMEARISAAVYSEVKNEFGRLQRDEIISTDPSSVENVSLRVTENASKSLSSYGIELIAVEIKKTDLPEDNAESVYQRMIAERQQIAAAYIAEGELEAARIRNDVDKQVEIIIAEAKAEAEKKRGQAEAEYMQILSKAYSSGDKAQFYEFMRSLDAVREGFDDTKTTLVLDEDSEIVKALLGK